MSIPLRTLVLNNQYMPLSLFPLYTIPSEEAIHRFLNGNCDVIAFYDRVIKTPSRTDLNWPSVVANKNGYSFSKSIRASKESLFYRDHCRCAYCGVELTIKTLTKDHVVPLSRGGKSGFENLVACCIDCNSEKGDSTSKKWKPKTQPWVPTLYQMIEIRSQYPIEVDHESWKMFLPNWMGEIKVRGQK